MGGGRDSSTFVAPPPPRGIPPVEHPTFWSGPAEHPTSRRPDPDGYDDSFVDFHGGLGHAMGGRSLAVGGRIFSPVLTPAITAVAVPSNVMGGVTVERFLSTSTPLESP